MSKNRITNDAQAIEAAAKAAPKDVLAFRAVAWRCPGCQLTQFGERSTTHVSECKRCKGVFNVRVKEESRG